MCVFFPIFIRFRFRLFTWACESVMWTEWWQKGNDLCAFRYWNHFKVYASNGSVHVVGATPSKKTKESNQKHTFWEGWCPLSLSESGEKVKTNHLCSQTHLLVGSLSIRADISCHLRLRINGHTADTNYFFGSLNQSSNFHQKIFDISRDFN